MGEVRETDRQQACQLSVSENAVPGPGAACFIAGSVRWRYGASTLVEQVLSHLTDFGDRLDLLRQVVLGMTKLIDVVFEGVVCPVDALDALKASFELDLVLANLGSHRGYDRL